MELTRNEKCLRQLQIGGDVVRSKFKITRVAPFLVYASQNRGIELRIWRTAIVGLLQARASFATCGPLVCYGKPSQAQLFGQN